MNPKWWQTRDSKYLSNILAKINSSSYEKTSIGKAQILFEALNLLWKEYFILKKTEHPENYPEKNAKGEKIKYSDNFKLELLLKNELLENDFFFSSEEVNKLVIFNPLIMNHDTLKEKEYNPQDIPNKLRKDSEEGHKDFISSYNRYINQSTSKNKSSFIKRLSGLLYIVRSNIMHGEKTQYGPDLEKIRRDSEVCNITVPLLNLIFEIIFNNPSHYLTVYGTLGPGEVNNQILSEIKGTWNDGYVYGDITYHDGLPYFRWNLNGKKIKVKIFHSEELNKQYKKLDRFEGSSYKRILIATEIDGLLYVTNIYEGNLKNRGTEIKT